MTVVVRIVRHDGQGLCGRTAGVVVSAAAPATAQALKRLASGSISSRAGITACGGNRSIRSQFARRAGLQRAHHAEYAPAGPR